MKKLTTTILFILFAINLMATVYWVSPTGTDAATGRTRSAAWQTLDKVSAEMQNGDIIRFKRSATWSDTLFITASNIKLIAWGEGKEPVIQFIYIDTTTQIVSFQNITVSNFLYPVEPEPEPDTTPPVLTAFVIPSTASALTVAISTLTATDDVGVTGYFINETTTAPLPDAEGWTELAPANYTFATEGAKTLYAWAKDSSGNVSDSLVDMVTITIEVEPETYPIDYTGTVYYISATGNDANNGLTEETPKAFTAASTLNPGSDGAVLLESSGDYVGTITPGYSGTSGHPVTYGAYGSTSSKPVISGSQILTGFTQRGSSNIYVKYITSIVTQLFEDDIRMVEARYPNAGYDYIETVNSTTSFTSTDLNASIDYTGAKWLGRTELYKMSTKTVSGSSGQTLSFATAPDGGLTVTTEGFILVGLLSLLDAPGEWCYNAANDTLYFWATDGADPDTHTIRATTTDYGINISNKNYVTVQDIEFKHQGLAGVYLYNADYITVDNNVFENQDATAIGSTALSASNNLTISNNNIKGANHYGMELYTVNSTVTDNVVDSTAIFTSLGGSGMGAVYAGSSYYLEGGNNHILYNKSENSGYNGIHFYGRNTIVEYNYCLNSMLTKDDGGGIYTSSAISPAGSIIRYNIVDGSYGTFNGFIKYPYTLGEAFYGDEESDSLTVVNNIAANINGGGYYFHKGGYHYISDNISFHAKAGLVFKLRGIGIVAENNKIYGFSRDMNNQQSERMVYYVAMTNNPTSNNNTFVQHYKSTDIFATYTSPDPADVTYSLATWRTATSQDASSTIDNSALTAGYAERLIYNETKATKIYYINNATNVTDAFSNASVTDTFSLAPFTGKVLEGLNLDCIGNQDETAPVITAFTIPSTSTSATITISSFTITGTPTAYKITESATTPTLESAGWITTKPTTYGVSSNGAKTLYAWARDAAGNISSAVSDGVTVTADEVIAGFNTQYATNSTTTVRRAMPVTMTENGVIQSVSFYHGGGTGTCLVGVYADDGTGPSTRLAISAETTLNVSAGWNTVNLISPVSVANGVKIWIAVTPSIGGLKYEANTPYRAQATSGDYSNGLPNPFGTSNQATGRYSIYCTYLK